MKILRFLFLSLLFSTQNVLASHTADNFRVAGFYSVGVPTAIEHDANRDVYFVAEGGTVLIMDLSQPSIPVVLSDSIATHTQVGGIVFDAARNLLYVAASDLFIWNVNDINNPVQVAAFTHDTAGSPGFSVNTLTQQGNMLYGTGGLNLHAIDITDPANPVLKDTYTQFFSGGGGLKPTFNGVASKGNFIFATGSAIDMRIYEYTPETGISFIHSTGWSVSTSRGPLVNGDFLYYYSSSFDKGLAIMDISSPDQFSIFSTPIYPEYATVNAVVGNIAYISKNLPGVTTAQVDLVDITDPFAAFPIASVSFDSLVTAMAASNHQAAIITKYDGLQIFNTTDVTNPSLAGVQALPGTTQNVSVSNNTAFLPQYQVGVQVIDLTDPTNPALLSNITTSSDYSNVLGKGDRAYVLDGRTMKIFDVSVLGSPVLLGSHQFTPVTATPTAVAMRIAVDNGLAVSGVTTELELIDVSDASNPILLGRYNTVDYVTKIQIVGTTAYIGTGDGLEIVDISNPAAPQQVGFHAINILRDFVVRDNVAYAVAAIDGFFILDVSRPSRIQQIGFYDVVGVSISSVDVQGNFAFISNGYNGVQMFDVSDPTTPTWAGLFADKNVRDIEVLDNYVVLASFYTGMTIVENLLDVGSGGPGPDPIPDPAPTPEPNQAPVANAGVDLTVGSRSTVSLNGTASFDPDGDALTYQWSQVSGKSVTLSSANSATPSFQAPRIKRRNKVLVFELTVTDPDGLSSTDSVTITVTR